MDVSLLMKERRASILAETTRKLARFHLTHYEGEGPEATAARLGQLFDVVLECLTTRNLAPIVNHAQGIARERFESGFDLCEVQTAFNVLEEVAWREIVACLRPTEFPGALGMLSTVLGAGKDSLARTYLECATRTKVLSLDLEHLFAKL